MAPDDNNTTNNNNWLIPSPGGDGQSARGGVHEWIGANDKSREPGAPAGSACVSDQSEPRTRSIHPSIHSSIHPSTHPSIHPFIHRRAAATTTHVKLTGVTGSVTHISHLPRTCHVCLWRGAKSEGVTRKGKCGRHVTASWRTDLWTPVDANWTLNLCTEPEHEQSVTQEMGMMFKDKKKI